MNKISLRVSEAGPQLGDGHDIDNKKSPNPHVPKASSLPTLDSEMASDVDKQKSGTAESGTVAAATKQIGDAKLDQQLPSESSTRANSKAKHSDSIEAMDISEGDVEPNSQSNAGPRSGEVKSAASPVPLLPTNASGDNAGDASGKKQIDSISVDTDRRSPVVNGSSSSSTSSTSSSSSSSSSTALPRIDVDATKKSPKAGGELKEAKPTEKLLNGEGSNGATEPIKTENVELNDGSAEDASAKQQQEKNDGIRSVAEAAATPSDGSRKRKASETLDDEGPPPPKKLASFFR